MSQIKITINNQEITCSPKQSILEVAQANNIEIPTLCYHPDVKTKQPCNMCLVKIANKKKLQRACTTKVKSGMKIITNSPELDRVRKTNLDKILAKHLLECDDCVWLGHCQLLNLVRDFKGKPIAEPNEKNKVLQVGSIVFDQTKCIGCKHCVEVCPTGYLKLNKQGKVVPSNNPKKECINCGQCILHCPVGAIEGIGEFESLDKMFKDPDKIVVAQFAPSLRTSVGEEFGLANGTIATEKLVAGLKQAGFDYVFDTATGADFTTMEESDELVERIQSGKNLPAMSSCCPAWVKFLEFNYPEFIPNLCTSRSPQSMLGGIIKNYWAQKNNINPKKVFVVSIMPCVAKKYEIKRPELKIDGIYPVDEVLTTRETVRLFKKNNIDLNSIKPIPADNPLGDPSGAGVIYGSSGGVIESATRTAYYKMTGKNLDTKDIKEVRGQQGIKTKEIKINDKIFKICVANGIDNAKKVLKQLKKNPKLYDAVEVMACPGGCVAGGGQSLPTNQAIVSKRSASLYNIDEQKDIKYAHDNPAVQATYQEFFTDEDIRKKILHTKFSKAKKQSVRKLKNSRETLPIE